MRRDPLPRIEPHTAGLPEELARRVRLTSRCGDCDEIPKVPNAGETRVDSGGRRVQVMHNGVLVVEDGYYGRMITEIIRALRGHHEPQEESVFHRVLNRLRRDEPATPTFVEIGSHWAYYSIWFLTEFPHGRAFCLEPDPNNLSVGQVNFALNNRSGTFIHACIGAEERAAIDFPAETLAEPVSIPQKTLESLWAEWSLGPVDAILIDAQGAEADVLAGDSGAFLRDNVRFAFISTHDLSITGSATTHQIALSRVEELGGHVIAEHSVSESFSGDGLIVASFSHLDADFTAPISYARSRDSLFGEWEPRCEAYRLAAESGPSCL